MGNEAWPWEWMKRKNEITGDSSHQSRDRVIEESWEEQAFAEDAAGALGGCVWPPRSYSCSFCRREFRSAQALGGHMNVHRRDRARLKQSPPDLHHQLNTNTIINPLHHTLNHVKIQQFPSQLCSFIYNPNPNSDNLDPNLISTTSSLIQPKQELLPSHSSTMSTTLFLIQENNKNCTLNASPQMFSWSNMASSNKPDNNHKDPLGDDQKVESGGFCTTKLSSKRSDYHHHVKTDLSVSLNLVLCRSCPTTLSGCYDRKEDDCEDDLMTSSCKKRKLGDIMDNMADDPQTVSPNCSVEELDLELRIGVGPHKVMKY